MLVVALDVMRDTCTAGEFDVLDILAPVVSCGVVVGYPEPTPAAPHVGRTRGSSADEVVVSDIILLGIRVAPTTLPLTMYLFVI